MLNGLRSYKAPSKARETRLNALANGDRKPEELIIVCNQRMIFRLEIPFINICWGHNASAIRKIWCSYLDTKKAEK